MRNMCLAVVLAVLVAVPASAQIYLEYMGEPGRNIPANCSTWHELHPNFCAVYHQDFYCDNGDGIVSACDQIVMDCGCFHVTWAGPTYVLEFQGMVSYWEPIGEYGPIPVCETWHQVYPEFCMAGHVDMWEDSNSDGQISPCDFVVIAGMMYHVVEIKLDIQVTPLSPVDEKSWGQIKSLFSTF